MTIKSGLPLFKWTVSPTSICVSSAVLIVVTFRYVMTQWKVGDIVKLKSGGPAMTVSELADSQVWCMWFEGTEQKQAIFPVDALESVRR
ncbi:MAG TPA: DUF2158 domain-containing protein [Candidatus Angelobacter sp.]